jgi:DNA invertase Pin-like site-specific DNA recombinase
MIHAMMRAFVKVALYARVSADEHHVKQQRDLLV